MMEYLGNRWDNSRWNMMEHTINDSDGMIMEYTILDSDSSYIYMYIMEYHHIYHGISYIIP